jgi:hypothetical protein
LIRRTPPRGRPSSFLLFRKKQFLGKKSASRPLSPHFFCRTTRRPNQQAIAEKATRGSAVTSISCITHRLDSRQISNQDPCNLDCFSLPLSLCGSLVHQKSITRSRGLNCSRSVDSHQGFVCRSESIPESSRQQFFVCDIRFGACLTWEENFLTHRRPNLLFDSPLQVVSCG